MKKMFILFAAMLPALGLFAQQPFVSTTEGMSMEYAVRNAKGKVEQTYVETVTSVTKSKGATNVVVTAQVDDASHAVTYAINGSNVVVSKNSVIESMFPSNVLSEQGVNIESEGDDIVYPVKIAVGKELPDYTITVILTSDKQPGAFQMIEIGGKTRKCTAEEEITTPAGTFNCFVIEETDTMVVTANGQEQANETLKSKEWFSAGIGTVKQEKYTGRGKLQSSTELTKLTKPE